MPGSLQTMHYPTDGTFYDIGKPVEIVEIVPLIPTDLAHLYQDLLLVIVKRLRCVLDDTEYIDKVISMDQLMLLPMCSQLLHECISPVIAIVWDQVHLPVIVVPYYANGNIIDYNRRLGDPDKRLQILEIISGLRYLHEEKDICHGNICSTNILIREDGGACISDCRLDFNMRQLAYHDHTPIPASYQYKSPEEVLNPCEISQEGDIYSLASVIYEVFSGKRPFHGLHHTYAILKITRDGHRALDRPSEISPELWSILLKCWALNPEDRPSIREVESEFRGLV